MCVRLGWSNCIVDGKDADVARQQHLKTWNCKVWDAQHAYTWKPLEKQSICKVHWTLSDKLSKHWFRFTSTFGTTSVFLKDIFVCKNTLCLRGFVKHSPTCVCASFPDISPFVCTALLQVISPPIVPFRNATNCNSALTKREQWSSVECCLQWDILPLRCWFRGFSTEALGPLGWGCFWSRCHLMSDMQANILHCSWVYMSRHAEYEFVIAGLTMWVSILK